MNHHPRAIGHVGNRRGDQGAQGDFDPFLPGWDRQVEPDAPTSRCRSRPAASVSPWSTPTSSRRASTCSSAWRTPTGLRTLNDYLWERCAIRETATDVTPALARRPAAASGWCRRASRPARSRKVLREGYDVGLLNDGFRDLIDDLELDYLLIDTHPGPQRGDAAVDRHLRRTGDPAPTRPAGLPGHRRHGRGRAQAGRQGDW